MALVAVPCGAVLMPYDGVVQLLLPSVGVDITFNAVDALRSWNKLQHETCMCVLVYRFAVRRVEAGGHRWLCRSESGAVDHTNYDETFSNTFTGSIAVDERLKRQIMKQAKLIEARVVLALHPAHVCRRNRGGGSAGTEFHDFAPNTSANSP